MKYKLGMIDGYKYHFKQTLRSEQYRTVQHNTVYVIIIKVFIKLNKISYVQTKRRSSNSEATNWRPWK
jgi:hypothetical protein